MLFPGEPKPIDGALSPEARAIGLAAAAATVPDAGHEVRPTRRERRRNRLAPAAE
jgi:hypothetical protein